MLISAIIRRVDELKANKYTEVNKLAWINHVDGSVWNEVYKHLGFADISRQVGIAAYSLPSGVDFSLVSNVYIDGEEIFKIDFKDFETTGYYRGADGNLNIYPAPTSNDTTPGLRVIYRQPFVQHLSAGEEAYISEPYTKVYDDYLSAMINRYNQEMDAYQNDMTFFNSSFNEYAKWYTDHRQEV